MKHITALCCCSSQLQHSILRLPVQPVCEPLRSKLIQRFQKPCVTATTLDTTQPLGNSWQTPGQRTYKQPRQLHPGQLAIQVAGEAHAQKRPLQAATPAAAVGATQQQAKHWQTEQQHEHKVKSNRPQLLMNSRTRFGMPAFAQHTAAVWQVTQHAACSSSSMS